METQEQTNPHKNKVHKILAHSYSAYLFFFLVGIWLDLVYGLKVFNNSFVAPVGYAFIILGTLLVFWAQKTSRNLNKENISKETFLKGPYRHTRMPTNFGLFFLTLGCGMIMNALFVIVLAPISFIVAKFVFIKKQERILAEKYGAPYLEYKKSVKF